VAFNLQTFLQQKRGSPPVRRALPQARPRCPRLRACRTQGSPHGAPRAGRPKARGSAILETERAMIGFNSREPYQDAVFDIQTQELPGENLLETRIYRNGKILASIRHPYDPEEPPPSVNERLSLQHEEVCKKVRDGNYSLIFLWISRAIIHYESGEYLKALECLDSVLAFDETHQEAHACLERIRAKLEEDREAREEVTRELQAQVEALASEGRTLEAGRKAALLSRLGLPPPPPRAVPKTAPDAPDPPPLPPARPGPRPIGGPPLSMQIFVAAACVLLLLCAGFIQADTQIRLHPAFHARMAGAYLEGGQILTARDLYLRLLRQDPASREALAGLWETFRRKGDYAEASRTLQSQARRETPTPELLFCLGEAGRLTDRCAEAIPFYREALRQGFPAPDGAIGLGLCLLDEDRAEEAIRLWEDLPEAAAGPGDLRVSYCLGTAYERTGRPGRASIYYSEALKQAPESRILCRALAGCLEEMHQTEAARMLLEKAESAAAGDLGGPPGIFSPSLPF